jgi:hypothetical protein
MLAYRAAVLRLTKYTKTHLHVNVLTGHKAAFERPPPIDESLAAGVLEYPLIPLNFSKPFVPESHPKHSNKCLPTVDKLQVEWCDLIACVSQYYRLLSLNLWWN